VVSILVAYDQHQCESVMLMKVVATMTSFYEILTSHLYVPSCFSSVASWRNLPEACSLVKLLPMAWFTLLSLKRSTAQRLDLFTDMFFIFKGDKANWSVMIFRSIRCVSFLIVNREDHEMAPNNTDRIHAEEKKHWFRLDLTLC
jgi:hypothetical protein